MMGPIDSEGPPMGLPTTPRELQELNEMMKRMRDEHFRKTMNDLMDFLTDAGAEVVDEVVEAGDLTEEDDETASDPGWEDRVYSDGFQVPDEDEEVEE